MKPLRVLFLLLFAVLPLVFLGELVGIRQFFEVVEVVEVPLVAFPQFLVFLIEFSSIL
jgi:hypothetical protein